MSIVQSLRRRAFAITRQCAAGARGVSSTAAAQFDAARRPQLEAAPEARADESLDRPDRGNGKDAAVEAYYERQQQESLTGHIGGVPKHHYTPRTLLTQPPSPQDVTLELLLSSQSHLGHATALWNPANSQYIFGIRDGIHIISLDVTAAHLRRAAKIATGVAQGGGLILFVGNRRGQDKCVIKAAELAGGCHLFEKWIPGGITNNLQILRNCKIKYVNELDEVVEKKTEGGESVRMQAPLKPDLVVCLNPLENYTLLHECKAHNIPTIGIIDTDANPSWVTYPIPANDDSLRCVQVIAGVLGRAGEAGNKLRLQEARMRAQDRAEDKQKW